MNKEDFKIFLRYIFIGGLIEANLDAFKRGIKWIKKPKNISYILMILGVYFFIKYGKPFYEIVAILFFLAALLQLRVDYLSGEHKDWNRKRLGIKSKKELARQEWDASKGEVNPKELNIEKDD